MRRANAPLPTCTSSPEVAILCVCWLHTAMRARDATQLRTSPRHVLRPTLLRAHSATRGRGRALAVKRATDRWPHRQENRRRHDQALARFQKYGGRLFISFFRFCPNVPATIERTLAPTLSPAYAHSPLLTPNLPYRRKA